MNDWLGWHHWTADGYFRHLYRIDFQRPCDRCRRSHLLEVKDSGVVQKKWRWSQPSQSDHRREAFEQESNQELESDANNRHAEATIEIKEVLPESSCFPSGGSLEAHFDTSRLWEMRLLSKIARKTIETHHSIAGATIATQKIIACQKS